MTSALTSQPSAPAQGMRKHWLLALVVLLLLVATPLAALGLLTLQQRPDTTANTGASTAMEAANALFTTSQYELAAQAYAQLLAQGYGGRALLYNLGVAQLAAGDAARAVDALSAAQSAYPRDIEIRRALADAERLARSTAPPAAQDGFTIDAEAGAAAPGLPAQVRLKWLSATEAALIALLLWTLFAAMLLLAMIAAPRSGARSAAVVAAFLLGAALIFALRLLTI